MKKHKILFIFLFLCLGFAPVPETKAQSIDVSFSMFQNNLSPYGRWINNPRFGQVWIYNDASFRPYYSDGHWEYTNYGWEWVSDFDWGWAPFHYGRWEYDPFDGWMWIPGYEWASAWVCWSSYDDYYGWAPLGYGVNINASFGAIPYDRWTFIPRRNICDRDIRRYYISPERNYNFRNAVVINNYYEGREGRFTRGPERSEVERYTHNRIEERRIDYGGRPQNLIANNNRNGNANNRQDRINNDAQRRFDNSRQDRMNNAAQRRFDNSRRARDMNTTPNPNENNIPRNRQVERPNNERQQNNFPVRPRETERQMNPVREQRNQPPMETRRNERPQSNYNYGQERQRNNDNNQSQRPNHNEHRRGN